jgi:hypothetical protein
MRRQRVTLPFAHRANSRCFEFSLSHHRHAVQAECAGAILAPIFRAFATVVSTKGRDLYHCGNFRTWFLRRDVANRRHGHFVQGKANIAQAKYILRLEHSFLDAHFINKRSVCRSEIAHANDILCNYDLCVETGYRRIRNSKVIRGISPQFIQARKKLEGPRAVYPPENRANHTIDAVKKFAEPEQLNKHYAAITFC